jgi:hypothetical protein
LLACLESRNELGLSVRVNLDDYDVLDVYYRGVREAAQSYRGWWTLYRKRVVSVRMFSRVAVLVRRGSAGDQEGQGEPSVLVKLFKDIILEDLKMTSPEVRVQMKLFDKIKVGGTVAGGLATPVMKLFSAAIISPVLLLVVVGGCVAALFKGVVTFLTSKTKYMQTLSSSLYHKNLANNMSALTLLVDAAEAEEIKELFLAYYVLCSEPERDYTMDELDARVEAWLRQHFDLDRVDFEVSDAVRKLVEKGLIDVREQRSSDGTTRRILKVHDLPIALARLDKWWDDYFSPDPSACS